MPKLKKDKPNKKAIVELIEKLGGSMEVARRLNVNQWAVQQWGIRGIPFRFHVPIKRIWGKQHSIYVEDLYDMSGGDVGILWEDKK